MRKIVVASIIVVFSLGLFVLWEGVVFLTAGGSPQGEERVVEVNPGDGFYLVAERLERQGIVRSAFYLKILARLSGYSAKLKVGEYAVRTDMRPMDILSVLASGKSIERQITFPEGTNLYEMAAQIEQKGLGSREQFIGLVSDRALIQELLHEDVGNLEGYLFPETYNYTKFTELKSLVKGMVARFLAAYQEVSAGVQTTMSRHQVVTLASMIEKETGAITERPIISSVFHNRLAKGMRLQSDPTIMYGMLAASGVMPTNISKADILHPTPYNTYTVSALPAGPIGSPGKESLRAALLPESTPYFYFVSKNDGSHTFSENYGEHNQAVQKFQVDRKAREGKSWRDLKKNPNSPTATKPGVKGARG